MTRTRRWRYLAVALAAGVALAACSGTASSAGSTGAGAPVKVGILVDATGPNASAFATAENGVKARFALANAAGGVNGHRLEYVVADTTSAPPGVLSAAQSLVRSQDVFAVLGGSAQLYAAADFLRQQQVPVIGAGFSGPQFGDPAYPNMFSVTGSPGPKFPVVDTIGRYFQSQGATTVGAVGYAQSAASTNGARTHMQGAEAVGLKVGYLNTSLPLGTTDVGSIALQIKEAGVDGLYLPIVPNTAFALLAALKQQGVQLKTALLATGYGGDLLGSAPSVQAAQGYDFISFPSPVELGTPATATMQKSLADYAGVTGVPTFAEQVAWLSADAFVRGLQGAGTDPTRESFTAALRGVHDYDAGGLYTAARLDFGQFGSVGSNMGPGNCIYVVRLTGQAFVPVTGAEPICGQLTGTSVAP